MSFRGFSKNNAHAGGDTRGEHSLRRLVVALVIISLSGLGMRFRAAADPAERKVIATFNTPVEIPGKALPAGTYVFKVLDDTGTRDIVQVFDKDEKQLLATLVGIPNYRENPPDKPIVNFEERRSDAPPAIKAVYFPGDTYGLEFVYPQDRATQLAKRTNQNVLSMSNDMKQNMAANGKTADASNVQQLEKTNVTGVDPSGSPVELVIIVGSKPAK